MVAEDDPTAPSVVPASSPCLPFDALPSPLRTLSPVPLGRREGGPAESRDPTVPPLRGRSCGGSTAISNSVEPPGPCVVRESDCWEE